MVPLAPLLYDPQGKPVEPKPTSIDDESEPEGYGTEPQRKLYQELPVYGVPPPDRTWVVEGILQQLEKGQFHDAAWLWDAMKRDARVRGVMRTRVQGLLGNGVECDVETDSEAHGNTKNQRAAKVATELFKSWAQLHGSAALGRAMDYALGLGACAVEKVYARGSRWNYRLKVWHPQYLTWDWYRLTYRLTTAEDQIYLPRPEHYGTGTPDDGATWGHPSQWMVFCPYGFDYAFLEGLIRALVSPWLARNWDQNDWARYNEIHGRPIRIAIAPEVAKEANKKAFFNSVGNLHGEAVIRALKDKDGNAYDVKLLEAQANTYETFIKKLEWVDKSIAILALGQSTSTDGAKGLGSDANPGDAVRNDVKKFDNTWVSHSLYEQGIREWVAFNWGDPDLAPVPPADDKRSGYWQVEPPADSAKRAKEFSDFATGFATIKANSKAIDERALLDEYGYPMVSEEEQAAAEQEEQDRADEQQQAQLDAAKQSAADDSTGAG